jgi:GTP-binding protein
MQIRNARFVTSAQDPSGFPDDGLPQIAVAGRSNVGKSSLLNMLVNRKGLVKTSSTPGKTRLINFFLVNEGAADGSSFYLVDIPGFGYAQKGGDAKRDMERAIEAYLNRGRALKGVLYLVDSRIESSAVDEQALEWLSDFDVPLLVVATKADKLKKQDLGKALEAMARRHDLPAPPIPTSSSSGLGRDEVLEQMALLLAGTGPDPAPPPAKN